MVKTGIPFELIEHLKLLRVDPIDLTTDGIATPLSDRRIVVKYVHTETFVGYMKPDIVGLRQIMMVALAPF